MKKTNTKNEYDNYRVNLLDRFLTFIANIKIYLTIWCENKQTFTQIEKVNPMKKQINIQEELFNEINNSFKNKKIIKTANKLTNNYLNQAKGTDFLVKAIAIPRACTIESSKKTGIWITNIKNNARIFIPNNFVYDEDKSKTTILIALPLFTNKKKFNCYLRKKGAQRSSNIGTIKAFIFLLKINVFYHIEKGKQKFNEKKEQTKQAVEQAWNKTTDWFTKLFWKPKPQKHGFDFTKLNENEIEKLKNYAIFKDYEFKSDDILYELVEFYKEYEQRDIEDLLYDEQHAEFVNSFICEKDEQWYKELEELL